MGNANFFVLDACSQCFVNNYPCARFLVFWPLAMVLTVYFVYITLFICALDAHAAHSSQPKQSWSLHGQGSPVYTASKLFPTDKFYSMYFSPKAQEAEPRPVVTKIGGKAFADSLNDPARMPSEPPSNSGVIPAPSSTSLPFNLKDQTHQKVSKVIRDSSMSKCDRCKNALKLGQSLAHVQPESVPNILIELCKEFQYKQFGRNPDVNKTCELSYTQGGQGGVFTQVLSYADLSDSSSDPDLICAQLFYNFCPMPEPKTLSDSFLNDWFHGQREESNKIKQRSKKVGKPASSDLRVLWTSDIHVDGRYAVGSEAKCTYRYCCHSNSFNVESFNSSGYITGNTSVPSKNITLAAPYWGYEGCDAPWSLVASAFQAMEDLGGKDGYDIALYTGDLVAHGQTWEESQELVQYSESALFDMMHRYLRNTTVISAIGNHDTSPTEYAAPNNLPDGRGNQFSWDWDYVSKLWNSEGWVNDNEQTQIRTHYGGYSISPRQGLRVISFNTDFWYRGNGFAFLHTSNPDFSGVLRWVTDELQAAEDAYERVWIIGHVLPGWDGYSSMDLPTNLFYQIVTRYQSTIAHMFFAHSHEDTFSVFYHNTNGNSSSASLRTQDAVGIALHSPSVTPLTNMNPGIRILQVNPETYEIMNYDQFYTPLQNVQNQTETAKGLVWYHLYSAREAYGNFSAAKAAGSYHAPVQLNDDGTWPAFVPLNASFWASISDEVLARPELATQFQRFQGRNSPLSPPCSNKACAKAKACFMRAGSFALGKACGSSYSTVQ